jgi:hypothetical protein
MPELSSARHELFAQGVASGLTGSEAYRRAIGKGKNADVHAAEFMARPGIKERIAEIRDAAAEKSELKREEVLKFLADVIRTPAGEVSKSSHLCQSFKDTAEVHQIRMPDKLAAIAQLSKLCGWNEPEKVEHGATDTLTEFLRKLRAG